MNDEEKDIDITVIIVFIIMLFEWRDMTKEELRKEFDELCDSDRQPRKMSGYGVYVHDDYKFDWFEEKYNALKQSHQEVVDRCIELEAKLISKDEKIISMYDEIDTAVRLYALERVNYTKLQEKLKAADEVINSLQSYIDMEDEFGFKYPVFTSLIEHYKSLKP